MSGPARTPRFPGTRRGAAAGLVAAAQITVLGMAVSPGPAHQLLAQEAPEPLGEPVGKGPEEPVVVADPAELLEILRYLQDFRRREEIEVALAVFNTQKAMDLLLADANSESLIEDLHRQGYLARPGGPPSGEGRYLHDADEVLVSTVFGHPEEPRGGPAALRHPAGFRAAPQAVVAAMETGAAAAFELGFAHLDKPAIEESWSRIAPALEGLRDPWAIEVVLDVLVRRSRAVREQPVPPSARPFLSQLVVEPFAEPRARWRAIALLYRAGQRDFPAPSEAEIVSILVAADAGDIPREAALAALESLGDRVEGWLIDLLEQPGAEALGGVLRALPRFGGERAARALVERLADPDPRWDYWRPDLLRSLSALTGADLGPDVEAWRRLVRERFGD